MKSIYGSCKFDQENGKGTLSTQNAPKQFSTCRPHIYDHSDSKEISPPPLPFRGVKIPPGLEVPDCVLPPAQLVEIPQAAGPEGF